jgi:hypothetical protein
MIELNIKPSEQKPKAYIPECCDFCRYCQCRFLKKYMDNIYRCKLMRYKTITTSINERPEWCPLKPVENEKKGAEMGLGRRDWSLEGVHDG